MSSRSLNFVQLIGNLTRDPELRYIPQGAAVCSFTIATNRSWMPSEGGERREETEFHRIVAWNKLAELCSQLLAKGRKVYVSGRLQTRQWETPEGQTRERTEVVIDDMIILDSRRPGANEPVSQDSSSPSQVVASPASKSTQASSAASEPTSTQEESKVGNKESKDSAEDIINVDDIPF